MTRTRKLAADFDRRYPGVAAASLPKLAPKSPMDTWVREVVEHLGAARKRPWQT